MAGLNDALFRGGVLTPTLRGGRPRTREEFEAEADANAAASYGDFGGGLASATRGMVGSTKAYTAAALEAAGAPETAQGLRRSAARDAARAAAIAPEIETTDQIDGPTNLGRYVMGKVGGGFGSIPPALVGGLAGRALAGGAGALGGATAAYFPSMAGGHVQEIEANQNLADMGAGEKFARATGVGAAQAALEGLGPAYLANRLMTRAPAATSFKQAAKNVGSDVAKNAALEGAGAAGSDVIGQTALMQADPTLSFDARQTFEAGVGEAIGGAGVSLPTTAAAQGLDYLAQAGQTAADAGAAVGEQSRNIVEGAKKTAVDAASRLKKVTQRHLRYGDIDRITAEQVPPPDLANVGEVEAWLAQDDDQRRQASIQVAQNIVNDPDASPAKKRAAEAMLLDMENPAGWKGFADAVREDSVKDVIIDKLGLAASELNGWLKGDSKKKENLEETPLDAEFDEAVQDELYGVLGTNDPELARRASKLLRKWVMGKFAIGEKGEARVPDSLVSILGVRAPSVLASVVDTLRRQGRLKMNEDEAAQRLNEVGKIVSERLGYIDKATGIVEHFLTPTMMRRIPKESHREIADALRHYLKTGETNAEVEQDLEQMFGRNKDVVIQQMVALNQTPASSLGGNATEGQLKGDGDNVDPEEMVAGEEDAGADAALDEFDQTMSIAEGDNDYYFKGAKGKEPFDRADPFHQRHVQLAKDRIDPNTVSVRYNKDTGADEAYTQEIGIDRYARDTGDNEMFDALRAKYPQLTSKQLGERFVVLATQNREIDTDPIDIKPLELKRPASRDGVPNKASWQDVTRVDSKKGNIDTSTISHGRIFLTPGTPAVVRYVDEETGEELPPGRGGKEIIDQPATKQGKEFVTSAQKLITKMWEAKKRGAFDDRAAEGVGPVDMLAMFAAGLSSLQATGQFHGEMRVKMPDGREKVINGMKYLPKGFVLYQGKDFKITIGDALKSATEGVRPLKKLKKGAKKYPAPVRASDKFETSDIPTMTRTELAGEYTRLMESLENPTLNENARDAIVAKMEKIQAAGEGMVRLDERRTGTVTRVEAGPSNKTAVAMEKGERVTRRAPVTSTASTRGTTKGAAAIPNRKTAVVANNRIVGEGGDLQQEVTVIDRDEKGNIFSKATAKKYAGMNDRVVKRGNRWVVERPIGFKVEQKVEALTETDEFGQNTIEREDNEARQFDETTGLELHPKEVLSRNKRAKILDQDITSTRKQFTELRAKIKEYEGKPGKNAIREGNLKKWREQLKELVAKGKELAAKRKALGDVTTVPKVTPDKIVQPKKESFKTSETMQPVKAVTLEEARAEQERADADADFFNDMLVDDTVDPGWYDNLDEMADMPADASAKPQGALNIDELDPDHVVWAVHEGLDETEDGKFLHAFFDYGKAQRYAEKVGGTIAQEFAGKYKASTEKAGQKELTDEQKAEVSAYIEKTLGPRVALNFTQALQGSGEWSRDARNQNATIRIALTAVNPLSVAHHEAMHEFFQRILDNGFDRVADTLRKAANSPLVIRQMERHFAAQPAVLKQIGEDVEERIAYMFQLWASGKLTIGTQTETVFRKIVKAIRKTLGMLSNEQKVERIFNAFHNGAVAEPGALAQIIGAEEARGEYFRKIAKKVDPVLKKANEWLGFAENALVNSGNPHLEWVGKQFHNKTGSQDKDLGFLVAKEQMSNRYMNKFADALSGRDPSGQDKREATKEDVDLALEGLQSKKMHKDPVVNRIQKQVIAVFKEMYGYMEESGIKRFDKEQQEWVDVKKIDDYRIPVTWDVAKIAASRQEFKDRLFAHHTEALENIANKANDEVRKKISAGEYTASWARKGKKNPTVVTPEDIADAIITRVLSTNGQEELKEGEFTLGYSPFAGAVNERTLSNWIDAAKFADFQEKDMVKILSSYVDQVTKRGEYSRRFGPDGLILQKKMNDAWTFEIDRIMYDRYKIKNAYRTALGNMTNFNRDVMQGFSDATQETSMEIELGKLAGKGVDGEKIMDDAVQALEPARKAVMAMEGTLGHDVSSLVRTASSYAIVYQNVRLLAYALFSNFIDPLGMIVRGGEVKDAVEGFKRGIRDVFRDWGELTGLRERKAGDMDEAARIAEMIGTVDSAGFLSQMGTAYGSQYLNDTARKINDSFFRWNGLESFNRAMRIQATQAAISFIKRHIQSPNEHSKRYFEELGMEESYHPEQLAAEAEKYAADKLPKFAPKASEDYGAALRKHEALAAEYAHKRDLLAQANDYLKANVAHRYGPERLQLEKMGLKPGLTHLIDPAGDLNIDDLKVQQAIMRWVEGSILRPNAAIRPTMSSDPHWAIFYHLKQFMYAMHATILKRVQVEIENGNVSPVMVLFAGYIPVMLAADAAKGLLQEAVGGGAPYWQHGTMGDVVAHGVQRAGLLGVGQMVPDAVGWGPLDVAGPTVEQVGQLFTQPLSESVADATMVGPLNMLLRGPDGNGANLEAA